MSKARMSLSLERIGKAWINGAAEFFAKLDPDPWQVAHDEVDEALRLSDSTSLPIALEAYESKALELLSIYKRLLELQQKKPPATARVADFFHKGFALGPDEIESQPEPKPAEKKELKFFK